MRFGRMLVEEVVMVPFQKTKAICLCDCGTRKTVQMQNLRNGRTQSCGCLQLERSVAATRTHGLTPSDGTKPPLYATWANMIERCTSPTSTHYKWYGSRGISVCQRWRSGEGALTGFECFILDMGPRPSPRHTVDREDNNGNYEPANCRWATLVEQANNRSNNRVIEAFGQTMTLAEATRRYSKITSSGVMKRLRQGWSSEAALTTPPYCAPAAPPRTGA